MVDQIKKLFDLAMDSPANERERVIDESDFADEVKAKVKRMLKIDVNAVKISGTILESVHVGLDIKPIVSGLIIDSYQLVESIGTGGQGEVWLAERVAGDFDHQVAVKFLKPVHDAKELARFRNERELLAQLKHNNIAQLMGGGELLSDSKSPRPYMILELVEGLPLLEYCQQQHFKLRDYLKVFLQICDAISYAHSHLVVHRDIKPNNIIVTSEGVVKLLDFGIAKLLLEKEIDTQTLPIMTLAYSSPEQVTGAPISTATDIYILGLLLYEMLTGRRAQAVSNEVPSELIHEITEKIPVTPSHVKQLQKLKRDYSNKQLKGDLDNLILMAIRKEPHRRYPTVSALAQDVKNYLDGKPLLATGDSTWYKVKKLVSRNPAVTLLSAVVMFFLVALPVVLFHSQQQISQQRDLEIAARKEAQQQSLIANRTKDFLINILESASPLASQGEDISLQDVLANSERQLEYGLENQPILKAELINTLSSIHHHLGDSKKAIEYYQKSLPIYEENNDLNGQVFTLGQLAVISILDNDPVGAKKYAEKADQLSQQLNDPVKLAWHHSQIATWQGIVGQKEQAHQRLKQSLLTLQHAKVEDHELLGRIYNELTITSETNEQALNYIDQALYHAESDHGKYHPKYFNRLINKGVRLLRMQENEQASEYFKQAEIIGKKLFESNHPNMSRLYGEMAILYHDTGEFNHALSFYSQAMQINRELTGTNSYGYMLSTNNLAYLYADLRKYDQAIELFRESLALRKRHFSGDPYRVASTQFNLARVLALSGAHVEAEELIQQVIPVYESKNKSILGAKIVQTANQIGQKPDHSTCQTIEPKLAALKTEVDQTSPKSWRRMYNELWLGQLAQKCQLTALSQTLLQAASERSQVIYKHGSIGQELMAQSIQDILK